VQTDQRHCGSTSRPWTVATARRGQRINVTVVDLSLPSSPHHAADTASADTDDEHCRRYAHFTEPEVPSSSRDRCDDDKLRHELTPLGEAQLYASQTGSVEMVLDSQTSATDKFLLIFTGA